VIDFLEWVDVQHMRKNQYEEHLFRCEDDRFDLDMCIQSNMSAIRAMSQLEAQLAELDHDDKLVFRIPEGALTGIHLRAIQRIYGVALHHPFPPMDGHD
jgi:paired amphipathic helix protein Sin3a